MTERPILFNTEMVRAILDGRKTQTRRIIKLAPGFGGHPVGESGNLDNPLGFMYPCGIKRPPCNKGDILWVRETWCPCASLDSFFDGKNLFVYKADYAEHSSLPCGWKPSIHMPKEAARIFLLVKDVRIERLRDITNEAALAEGMPDDLDYPIAPVYCPRCKGEGLIGSHIGHGFIEVDCPTCDTAMKRFINLWTSTIKKADLPVYSWDANPWVWVIEFERCEPPKEG